MTQYVIDTGEFPNDGTGDPLRTAFEYVNLNFDQVFAAGPVLSNIAIENNTIYSINTNGNIVLNPNGIGNVIANAHVIPDQTRIRNLGAPGLLWDSVYAQYFVGDGNGISNVTVSNISNGTARVDSYFNGNIVISANGVSNVAVFTANGVTISGTVLAGTVSGNVNTSNISGESITISATGNNQSISLAPSGSGNVNVNFKRIVNLAEPVNPQDAATKYYVDTMSEGLDVKASCLLATTGGLPAYTYNNGASGVGATITGNAVGLLNIDSTAVTASARVLIKNESGPNAPFNGIYIVTNTGNSTAAFQLTRSTDFDNGAPSGEIPGAFTFIETGATNADTGWVCTTDNPVTIGVTPVVWTQFSGAGAYTAGLGLNLVGGVFNVLVDNDTTEINLNNQVAVKPSANLVTPNIGAATGTSLSLTGGVTANSVNTSGAISTAANITGGNLLTSGMVSATGTIRGGNLFTAGFVSSTGQIVTPSNITGGNITTPGSVSAVGNVTGGNLVTANNVVSNNVVTSNTITAGGNITGANLNTLGTVTAVTANVSGNVNSGNILNSGIVTAAGNVTGGNIRTAGQITATGNLTVGNVRTAGLISAGGEILANGNISGANIAATGIVTASGNIISNQYFIGNGAFLTGIDATSIQNGNSNVRVLANSNVVVGVAGTANLAVFANTGVYVAGVVSATGDIYGANLTTGNVTATGDISANSVLTNTVIGTNVVVSSTGNITLSTTGNINVGNTHITNLANPVNLQDAATKFYVDHVATGLDPKESVVYATVVALGVPYTYNNGVSGVGATLTANMPGNLTVDGNVIQGGQRILVKNETGAFVSNTQPSAAFNGIYDVTVAGDGLTPWVLTRSADFNQPAEMVSSFTFVEEGSTNADTGWVCVTNNPITIGFTSIVFTQFSGAGTYTAGNGLSLNGTVFNVNTDGNITINGNNQVSIATNAILNSPNITNATATSLSATGNITGGNILFGNGIVSGTGNIYANKIFANIQGNVDAAGNLYEVQFNTTGDQLGANANFTYDFANNVLTIANGNIQSGNVLVGANVSAVGNVHGSWFVGNVDADIVTATANITGGNILTAGSITATGNITGGNVNTGALTSTGELIISANASGILLNTTGNVNVGNVYINNLADPLQAQDAATKAYVDSVAEGLIIDAPVSAATPANLATISGGTITYNNGNAGVGATLVTTGTYANIDSYNIASVGTRVLVKDEANLAHNGIYTYANATALVRATDYDQPSEITGHDFVFVEFGTIYAGTGWVNIDNVTTVGTDPIEWIQFSGAGTIQAGNGIAVNGTQVNVLTDGITTGINGSNQVEVIPNAQLTTPNIGAATGSSLSLTGNVQAGNVFTGGAVSATGTVTGGNILFGNGIVSGTGNIYANKIFANIVGNVDAAGNLTEIQFNSTGDQLGANANFTYDSANNVFTVANGNIVGGNLLINNNISANGNITNSGFISAVGNVTAPWFIGNVDATTLSALGNIVGGNIDAVGLLTAGNISTAGNVNSGNILNSGIISSVGNITAPEFTGNVSATTVSASGNIDAGNLIVAGNVSAVGNVTAPTFFGNLVGNITGNIDAGGANTQIQFNDDDILAGSAAFTFDKTSNLVTITGNVTAGNVTSQGIVTANLGVYGDIYTTSIDSADSSAVIVTPDMILLASLDVNQDITVGNIVIPSYGNITVGNVRIANLATPIFNQDAVTKQYVDSAIGNVLPIITNQTINPDGSSLTYTLDQATTAVGVLVTINGISQTPGDSYTVTGDQITFAELLLTSDIVQVRFLSGTSTGGGGTNYANANVVAYAESGWAGNIIPQGNLVYNLGNSTNRWNDLYLSGNTIYLDSATIGANGADVTFSGNVTGAYIKGNGSELTNLPAPTVTQDITSNGAMSIMTYDGVIKYVNYATVEPSSGNITGGNILTSGLISASGNVTGNYILGNGSQLTGLPATYGNSNVATFLASYGSNTISTTGNITAGNLIGNISITGNVTGTSANVQLVAGSYTYTFDNTGVLTLPAVGGDEGGEINFGIPAANTTLIGPVKFDVYQDRIRFFDGSTKGAYIDLSQAAAGVGTLLNNRVSGFVNAGTFVTMDLIKATVTTSGQRGLSLATTTGTISFNIGGNYSLSNGTVSGTTAQSQTLTTSATTSIFGWSFPNAGDTSTYIFTDTTNSRAYRITLMIGASYNNNMISIERLI
jgi:hypothetical protein